ncbi:MAG: HAMP domain-containing histidine kinase [Candidatus Odyssella sp.]|nr:HAMP domain-containing histidine kinase [Candidatus Odyssella sp.]
MATRPDQPASSEIEAAQPQAAVPDALTRWLGRLGYVGASAVLVATAVLLALGAHAAFAALSGETYSLRFAAEIAAVMFAVATPIVLYAQRVIRQLDSSRRVLKRMTERLAVAVDSAERANVAKSQFLANMSHELRTPLNAIIGFSDLIQAETFGPVGNARYIEYLKDISKSGHHLLGIVNGILDLSKIEAGRASVQDEEEFNVAAVLDASLRMMRPLADREKIALELAVEARGLRLVAVERMVCQILLNLLSNAVKFTPAGGRVALSAVRTPEGGLLVAVADTGLGMTPAEVKIALTPFGQVQSAQGRKHLGTGLGLPLAKAMMELHGGSLRVASAPGQGTTVSLLFPPERVAIRADAGEAREAAPQQNAGDPARRVA